MYDPDNENKMISFGKGYGEVRLYPEAHFDILHEEVIFCEGEWDAIQLQRNGFNAITCTGGAGTWKDDWLWCFVGKKVVLVSYG